MSTVQDHGGHTDGHAQHRPGEQPGGGHAHHAGHSAGPTDHAPVASSTRAVREAHGSHDKHAGHDPEMFRRRFWLHLLRNLLMKSVIRVGAGYFERSGGFFLIGTGASGSDLRQFTLDRLRAALDGLREDRPLSALVP